MQKITDYILIKAGVKPTATMMELDSKRKVSNS